MARNRVTWRYKEVPCISCGNMVKVGLNARKQPRCLECGIERMRQTTREIKARSGPGYEKWLDGIARYAAQGEGGGGVVDSSTIEGETS